MHHTLIHAIHQRASSNPERIALCGFDTSGMPTSILYREIAPLCQRLRSLWDTDTPTSPTIAILCDNTPDIALLDLALLEDGITTIPIPPFFSPQQCLHLLQHAAVTSIITDQPTRVQTLLTGAGLPGDDIRRIQGASGELCCFRLPTQESTPSPFDKITFTSGSTGEPKGVCLSQTVILQMAQSLVTATGANAEDRHLCLLPYATLLENIGGIYVPLLAGACITLPGLARVGLQGASGLNPQTMVEILRQTRATSCIMVPQMLLGLVSVVAQSPGCLPELRFVAVGGAPVSPALLQQAESLGLPVFEGYGLSEAASVVAVNTPEAYKIGSVGKPLPHVTLKFSPDGELLIKGAIMQGYLGRQDGACDADGFWHSGDLGQLDDEGFLYLTGRRKQIFITAFGRNVAPEWVERELTIEPAIAQAAIFGEAKPFNVAVIVTRDPSAVAAAIRNANGRLPDYARIQKWVIASEPFTIENGQASSGGAPRRDVIATQYRENISACYTSENGALS